MGGETNTHLSPTKLRMLHDEFDADVMMLMMLMMEHDDV